MCRRNSPLTLAALALTVAAACGRPPVESKDGKLVVPLVVTAAALPRPALTYHLLPEFPESQPGNQIPAFYKCFFEQHHFYFDKESVARRDQLLAAPLSELAGDGGLAYYGGVSLKQADYAARLEYVDWQVTNQLKAEGYDLLLPDVQQLRVLAVALRVRMRGEVARKDYPAALRTARTLFALARAFASHPTLVGNLVGLAVATDALDTLEELVQQPGAPNLFWALTALPDPLVDMRSGMSGDRALIGPLADALGQPEPLSDAVLKRIAQRYEPVYQGERRDPGKGTAWDWYRAQAGDAAAVAANRERLIETGFDAAALDPLSPLQTVMAGDFAGYRIARDDLRKSTGVPFHRLPPDAGGAEASKGPFAQLLTAYRKVRLAQVRTQQRVALLQSIEAVRAHAALNGGAVPGTLDEVKLPVPPDPVTGKAFRYEVREGKAVIRATPPADRKDEPAFNRVYEVTVRK